MAWDDVRLFLAIAESGSIGKAAKALRIAQPTVSRRLGEIEARYGFALFRRTTTGVSLTPRAERLIAPARHMAEWAAELARAVDDPKAGPRGVVRVTAPPGVAADFLGPFAGWLRQKQPAITLEVLSSVNVLDLSRGEADLAIRSVNTTRDDLVRVAVLEHDAGFFASPDYIARLPEGYGFADVDFVGWSPPLDVLPPNPQLAQLIPGFTPVFTSDSFLVQLAAAENGVGAIALARVGHRFSRGSNLVELALDLGAFARVRTALVASKRALEIPRVRVVADLLAKEFERARGLTKRKKGTKNPL